MGTITTTTTRFNFLVSYDLKDSDMSVVNRALGDPAVTDAVQTCLGKALMDLEQNPEFRSALKAAVETKLNEAGFLASLAASFVLDDKWYDSQVKALRVMGEHLNQGKKIDKMDGSTLEKLVRLGASAGSGYVSGWNLLSQQRRRRAAEALLEHIKQALFETLSEFIACERDRFIQVNFLHGSH